MKVVLLNTNDNGGGAAIACLRLQQALQKHGTWQSTVLVQDKHTNHPGVVGLSKGHVQKALAWLRFVAERLVFLPRERSPEVRFQFDPGVAGIDISTHPLVRDADIIHLHWINHGFLSTDSLHKIMQLGKPVVWTFHDMWAFTGGCHHSGTCENFRSDCGDCKFIRKPDRYDFSHQRWRAKSAAYASFAAVGCSRWLANRARNAALLNGYRVEAIPNPLDVALFRPLDKRTAREALGLNVDKTYLLFAAMKVSAPGKGFAYFAEALQWVTAASDNVELLVFGKADEALLAALPIRVTTLGHLTDPERIVLAYSAAALFVIPSLEENLPNTLMEAMACGTPAVGFDTGGIPEMIDHRVDGYVADYRSAESLAAGIRWVLDNNKGGKLSKKARQKVLDTYAEDVVAAQYEALYQSLM